MLNVFCAPANLKTLAAHEHGRTVQVACAGAQSRRHDDPSCSVRPLRLRFLFHLKDVSPECAEFLFKVRLRKRAVAVGHLQSDICPVFWRSALSTAGNTMRSSMATCCRSWLIKSRMMSLLSA